MKSARARREQYVGPWLPEPVAAAITDPLERAESLSYALMVMLESLTPAERAVFILREAFDVNYAEIAVLLETSEANCRQLLSRAKQHIAANRPRFTPDPARQHALMSAFFQAAAQGDLRTISSMLQRDAVLLADGGGKVPQPHNPSLVPIASQSSSPDSAASHRRTFAPNGSHSLAGTGRGALKAGKQAPPQLRCAGTYVEAHKPLGAAPTLEGPSDSAAPGVSVVREFLNSGQPAMLARSVGALITIAICDFDGDRIRRVYMIRNPDKMRAVTAP